MRQHNGQDAAFCGRSHSRPHGYYGLVLDGCGSKYRHDGQLSPSHHEVGAQLLGHFAAGRLGHQLGSQPLAETLAELHHNCLAFLSGLADLTIAPNCSATQRQFFIYSHLLTTLVGFALTPTEGAFFWAGDGYLCLNGQVRQLESDNRPDYLAYGNSADWQTQFFDPAGVQWLAVATDGWTGDTLTKLATPRSSLALQRWLNLQARQLGQFEDDGAVAVWQADL